MKRILQSLNSPSGEAGLFYLIVFGSSIFTQIDADLVQLFSNPFNIALYIILSLPPVLFVLLLFFRDGSSKIQDLGLNFQPKDLVLSLKFFISVYISVILFMISLQILLMPFETSLANPIPLKLPGYGTLITAFLVSFFTGLYEELFFRVYLFTRFRESGHSHIRAAAVSIFLFAILHLYQGIGGFLAAGLIGSLFQYFYIKEKRFWPIALGHGLYNGFTFVMAFFFSPV
jgi:membrane protease YdiL (CAAX protease family)